MNLTILHQESYSRGELLLRTFFGWLYIGIPHGIVLALLGIVSYIITIIAFFAILFTGRYPQGMFEFQAKYMAWSMRVNARLLNLVDGYPPFAMEAPDDPVQLDIDYPESLSRGMVLLKLFFGWLYVGIPHGIVLILRLIAVYIIIFVAFFVVLFTGNYPEGMHSFVVGTYRWSTRVNLYLNLMTDEYPPFSSE